MNNPSQIAFSSEYNVATGIRNVSQPPFTQMQSGNPVSLTSPVGSGDSFPPSPIKSTGALSKGKVILGATAISIDAGQDIQQALDSLNAISGGTLYLAAGTYKISASLTGYSSISIQGVSPTATIIDFQSASRNLAFAGTNIYSTGTVTAISAGVNVTGSGTTWTAAMAGRTLFLGTRSYIIASITDTTHLVLAEGYGDNVTLPSSYRITTQVVDVGLKNIGFKNSTTTAVTFNDCRRITLNNVQFISDNVGFSMTNCSEFDFSEIAAISSTGDGIQMTNVGLGFARTTEAPSNGGNGFTLSNLKDTYFIACAADGNTSTGVSITTGVNLQFTVDASSNGGKGVELVSGCSNVDFISGRISSNTSDGIKLTASATYCHIYGNDIQSNGGYGINVAVVGDTNTIITTNDFVSNTSGAVNDAGTTTVIRGNTGVADNSTSSALNYQVFTTTGTWTKPSGLSGNELVIVRIWGGGGGGGGATSQTNNYASGGGGGGYFEGLFRASDLASTVTVTVGTAGTAGTSAGTNGGNGGNTTFGSIISAYGGPGGTGVAGGGGNAAAGVAGGDSDPRLIISLYFGGAAGAPSGGGQPSIYGGGGSGGGSSSNLNPGGNGGASSYGGGGGAGGGSSGSGGAGKVGYGGAGGSSGGASGAGLDGSAPAGGGGAAGSNNGGAFAGGAGARGECRVWIIV